LEVRTVTFQVTLHRNGSLCGLWLRIWTGVCSELLHASELLDLFQDIVLFTWEQSLTAESLIWQKSRKVQSDMRTDKWDFLLCPDEKQPTSCWLLVCITDWSQPIHFLSLISFVTNALLGVQAQWATHFPQIFHESTILREKRVSILLHAVFEEI
jgi:hypothetical protein